MENGKALGRARVALLVFPLSVPSFLSFSFPDLSPLSLCCVLTGARETPLAGPLSAEKNKNISIYPFSCSLFFLLAALMDPNKR